MGKVKEKLMTAPRRRQYYWDTPVVYDGKEYPATFMDIEDANGNVRPRQVFANKDGMYYGFDNNGALQPVILQNNLDEVTVAGSKQRQLENLANALNKSLTTVSNDQTKVLNLPHREYNQHLMDNAVRGAEAHAAWDKENPNAAAWGNALAALPFIAMAYPFAAGAGEYAAGTALGQGITNGLNFMANAPRLKAALPWIDAALTSYAGAEGIEDVKNGKFTPETALDLAPFLQMARPVAEEGKALYNTGKELGKNITKGNMVGAAFSRYTGDRFFNSNLAKENYLTENLQKSLPFMPETEISSIYKNAFKNKDYKTGQTIRDWHFLNSAPLTKAQSNGAPILYYHGAPHGSFTTFDSGKLNNTIGGIAAVGEKGNFTTTDLQAAKNYAEGLPFSGLRLTDSPLDELVDLKGLRDRGDLYPSQYTTAHEVYPLYANINDPAKYDFEGNAWNAYPHPEELGRKWKLDTNHTFIDNGQIRDADNTEIFTSRQDLQRRLTEMKSENYDFGKKTYKAINRDGEWVDIPDKGRSHRKGEVNPSTGKWEYYPDKKSITRLESRRIKPTTNGVAEQSFDNGHDSVIINNVQDANPPQGTDNWPIDELVFRNSNQVKLANPFTVDDEGKLISIFDRDNFSNPDIRYSIGNSTLNDYQNVQAGVDYPLKGQTEIPKDIKRTAVNKYNEFINSDDYYDRLKKAGLENHLEYIKDLTDRQINNIDYFPSKVEDVVNGDPKALGAAISRHPSKGFRGIILKNNIHSNEIKPVVDHELAHYATANATIDNARNFKVYPFSHDLRSLYAGDIMRYNESIVPNIDWDDILKTYDPKTTSLTDINDAYKEYLYLIDPQEKRARAYSILQQAKDEGLSTDAFVDRYMKNGKISEDAPYQLQQMGKILTIENLKKYLKNFLSISAPLGFFPFSQDKYNTNR